MLTPSHNQKPTVLHFVIRWKKGSYPCSLSLPIDAYSPEEAYAFEADIRKDARHTNVTSEVEEVEAR